MRLVTGLAVLAAMGLLTGCGGSDPESFPPAEAAPTPTAATTPSKRPSKPKLETTCIPAKAPGYRVCETVRVRGIRLLGYVRSTIEARADDGWRIVTRQPRGAYRHPAAIGMWGDVWRSPDGRTLLAQWQGECDAKWAFFVPADGGRPQVATGERNWQTSAHSWPRGWSADGHARVWVFPNGGCGGGEGEVEPGRYLIDPETGRLDYVQPLPPPYRS